MQIGSLCPRRKQYIYPRGYICKNFEPIKQQIMSKITLIIDSYLFPRQKLCLENLYPGYNALSLSIPIRV